MYQQKEQGRDGLGRARENETSLPAIVTGQEMSHPHFHACVRAYRVRSGTSLSPLVYQHHISTT